MLWEVLKPTIISIVVVFLSVLINIINMAILQPNTLDQDPNQVLAVGSDLILVSFSVLIGLYLSSKLDKERYAKLFLPMLGIFIFSIFNFVLIAISATNWNIIESYVDYFRIWIPNLLGLISISWSVITGLR